MRDQDRTSLELETVRALAAELVEARKPDRATIAAISKQLAEANRARMRPAVIKAIQARLTTAKMTPNATPPELAGIEARLKAAHAAWQKAWRAERDAKRASQEAEPAKVIAPRSSNRNTAANRKPLPKQTPDTAELAKARTVSLEAKAARREQAQTAANYAKSQNVEAMNAARVAEIVAYIERMATPDPARIAQALRTERPAVRRAVTKYLQNRKQAA